jgi:hypothetical protein
MSHRRVSQDIELGLLTGDKAENGNRSRSSSELSYGYQYDTNAAGTSAGDPKAQATYKPVRTASTHSPQHKNLTALHIPTVSLSATWLTFTDHDGIRPVNVQEPQYSEFQPFMIIHFNTIVLTFHV